MRDRPDALRAATIFHVFKNARMCWALLNSLLLPSKALIVSALGALIVFIFCCLPQNARSAIFLFPRVMKELEVWTVYTPSVGLCGTT